MAQGVYRATKFGTIRTFLKVGSCSETACSVLDRHFGTPMEAEEKATMPLAGGIVQYGYQCGLLWGAVLAAGAESYRRYGATTRAEVMAVHASRQLVALMQDRYGEFNCYELTKTDWRSRSSTLQNFLTGGPFRCFSMAAKYATAAVDTVETALDDDGEHLEVEAVSCASALARRMGLSDMHVVMAAGLAGGIGFSGGGCGALGAAVWIMAMKTAAENGGKVDYKDARVAGLIDRFMEHTEGSIECEEIVGRRFTGVVDHAAFLGEGGCAGVLAMLAESAQPAPVSAG